MNMNYVYKFELAVDTEAAAKIGEACMLPNKIRNFHVFAFRSEKSVAFLV